MCGGSVVCDGQHQAVGRAAPRVVDSCGAKHLLAKDDAETANPMLDTWEALARAEALARYVRLAVPVHTPAKHSWPHWPAATPLAVWFGRNHLPMRWKSGDANIGH